MERKYRFVTWDQDENNETQFYTIYEMPEEEFVKIEPANNTVFEVLRIEELFDLLVDNLFEFNKIVISYADKARLQTLYFGNSLQIRIDVNRTALNFFAALNLYQDFLEKNFNSSFNKDFWNSNKKFQRCVVMRNYIQHVEFFPVTYNISYVRCDLNVMLSSVRFQVDVSNLKIDQLSRSTQNKFNDHFNPDEKVDLYEIINQGMGEIQLIQQKIRNMPLYTDEYEQAKQFLLDIENKISRHHDCIMNSHLYFELNGDNSDLKNCHLATDMIGFIDENIRRFPCENSNANRYITTAPQDFVKKCSDKIFSPAVGPKLREEAQKNVKGNVNA